MTKTIPERYWNELKDGSTMPRDEKTGEVIPFKVGWDYDIVYKKNGEKLKARCTQNCPYTLKLLQEPE